VLPPRQLNRLSTGAKNPKLEVVVALGGNTPATAHPSHTSCKTFGTGTGDVARGGTPPGAGPGTAELVASLHEDECE